MIICQSACRSLPAGWSRHYPNSTRANVLTLFEHIHCQNDFDPYLFGTQRDTNISQTLISRLQIFVLLLACWHSWMQHGCWMDSIHVVLLFQCASAGYGLFPISTPTKLPWLKSTDRKYIAMRTLTAASSCKHWMMSSVRLTRINTTAGATIQWRLTLMHYAPELTSQVSAAARLMTSHLQLFRIT